MTPEQIREQYNRKIEKIRGREDLTPQAKQVAMARAHQTAAEQIAAVREADQRQYEQRRQTLEKRLFGNRELSGTDALSARDARERAAQYTHPDEALKAYQRAQRDGDKDMMRALGSMAADQAALPVLGQAWYGLVEAHAAATPGYAGNLEELRGLHNPDDFRATTYVTPDVPSELGRMSPQQVASLADSPMTVYGNDAPEAA
ncbi:hypothetical protein [Streptomyces parvulus]|uniref:Uncharacterized protein n=1 Tax=Streptomyces parvulus TaxID=146923 RepID=A0A191UWU4_9ACTN|nr:hypothetical protein [Streptomyces parvulus]ANJ07152.1 hypothetical protein Spa2297_09130 [Streptomyces parvulus]GGR74375.1 hypothetical protein GCM10010220_28350 [Streptomyces parvulus]